MDAPRSRTVGALLAEMADRFPEREAVVDARRRLTYRAFRDESLQVARGLYSLGVRPGDHVAILMGNVAEWLVTGFAVASLGATLVSVNTWATRRELAYLLDHSETVALVFSERFINTDYVAMLAALRKAGEWPDRLRAAICLGGGTCPEWATPYAELPARADSVPEAPIVEIEATVAPSATACLLYTSGSTSRPKGVPLTHAGLIENMWSIGERQHLTEQDRLWLAVSLFWALGCNNALFALMTHGGCIVLQEHFDASEALRLLEVERCTVFYGTPNMTLALWEHPDRAHRDLSSLRTGVTIGKPDQIRMAMDLGAREICNVYGMTETYANSAVTDASLPAAKRVECVGPPLPGTRIRIVDPDSERLCPPGSTGEIRVRGYVMPGYYKDPEKTAEAIDTHGFFRTGDLGFLDEDGCLYFRGRLKEMVKTGGINVSPAEVEDVLSDIDGVAQAYVVGLPDPERDEIVAAVLVLEEGWTRIDLEHVRRFCRERMAAYKVPRRFRIALDSELPLTSTRKLKKLELPALFEGGPVG